MPIHHFVLAFSFILTCSPALAGQFRLVNFDLNGTSWVTGINTAGQVIGTRGRQQLPFVWTSGTFATLPRGPDGVSPVPEAISDNGIVVGSLFEGWNGPFPKSDFYRYNLRTKKVVAVPAPSRGLDLPVLTGVDNAGIAVGFVPILTGPVETVTFFARTVWEDGLLPLGCFNYEVVYTGINANGLRTGYCSSLLPVPALEAFEEKGGIVTPILTQYYQTIPNFVDNAGRIGGFVIPSAGDAEIGFLYKNGKTEFYNDPLYTDNILIGTGPKGEVIGQSPELNDGFWIYRNGHYTTVHLHSFTNSIDAVYFARVNASGSIVGDYYETQSGWHGFAEICDADQFPCTQ